MTAPCTTAPPLTNVGSLEDRALLASLERLVGRSRRLDAELVAHVAEVDARRLYLDEACPSMFVYATTRLGLAEGRAYRLIRVGRLSRSWPVVLELLAAGRLHLAALFALASHLTPADHEELLQRAEGLSKRELERLLAARAPQPEVPDRVAKLPGRRSVALAAGPAPQPDPPPGPDPEDPPQAPVNAAAQAAAAPAAAETAGAGAGANGSEVAGPVTAPRRADDPGAPSTLAPPEPRPVVAALARGRYRIQFTASQEWVAKLRRAQELLRHQQPDGDLAAVLERALDQLNQQLLKRFGLPAGQEQPRAAAPATMPMPTEPAPRPTPHPAEPPSATEPPPETESQEEVVALPGFGLAGAAGATAAATGATEATEVVRTTGAAGGVRSTAEAAAAGGSGRSRYIPAAVRREIFLRDQGRCTFRDTSGRRCSARGWLEYHHLVPFACGGSHDHRNLELRCQPHNLEEARQRFGSEHVEQRIAARGGHGG